MSDKNLKDVRKQIKNALQSELPSLLSQEFKNEAYKQLSGEIQAKLSSIELSLQQAVERIEKRQKDVQDFALREMMASVSVKNKE